MVSFYVDCHGCIVADVDLDQQPQRWTIPSSVKADADVSSAAADVSDSQASVDASK